jgi:hypothetical protein
MRLILAGIVLFFALGWWSGICGGCGLCAGLPLRPPWRFWR